MAHPRVGAQAVELVVKVLALMCALKEAGCFMTRKCKLGLCVFVCIIVKRFQAHHQVQDARTGSMKGNSIQQETLADSSVDHCHLLHAWNQTRYTKEREEE